jgi:TetR/AcrR family transcriptional repressor of lmrAB and yxaGH operons
MARRVISDDAFLEVALDLFRTYGFEGGSLKMLSDKTGLEKASLHYRYPAGKDQIVTTVAESVAAWFESNIFDLLNGTGTPRARITLVAERLEEFYLNGGESQYSRRSIDPVWSRGTAGRASQNDAEVGRCVY